MKIVLSFVFLSVICTMAFAEDVKRSFDAKLIFGASAFLDEEIPFDHSIFGASIPVHLTERLSIEPQLLYMKGPGTDHDLTVMGNVVYDLFKKERFTGYVVGGAGVLSHSEKFGSSGFTVHDWTANGGVGVKIHISKRIFIAPEFRFGTEPLLTATTAIGFSF